MNVQTKGLRKFKQAVNTKTALGTNEAEESIETQQKRWSSIAGRKRKERLALLHGFVAKNSTKNRNPTCSRIFSCFRYTGMQIMKMMMRRNQWNVI